MLRLYTRQMNGGKGVLMMLLCGWARATAQDASAACATCHREIAAVYRTTPMARTSSRGVVALPKQDATVGPYRLLTAGILQYPGGERKLEFTLGSGSSGHSYLFRRDGYLYQAPVSYYRSMLTFDHSPGYSPERLEMARAVEPACLQCHTTGMQPVAGTQNRFADPPYREDGIGCERCHGSGAAHRKAPRRGNIVNPAKLDPERRDSVCAQCHLTGAARIARTTPGTYQPGGRLSEHLAVFVWTASTGELSATSHYDRLEQSGCKKASGAKLWCGSCHSPHPVKAASYDAACQNCHATKPCTAGKKADCAGCHMPKGPSRTVDHLAFTDHAIPRKPGVPLTEGDKSELVSFWRNTPEVRDLALGYSVVAPTVAAVRPRTLQLLQKAEAENPKDVPVLAQLATFYERMRRGAQAAELTERIYTLDPNHQATLVNLGSERAKQGRLPEAIALWKKALLRNPALTPARVNLAVALYQSGEKEQARRELETALVWDPGSEQAQRLLDEMR
ncbi:MAG: tetratricopeptide repeat protein [Bryobacterales bacterium]|nr:tetratricopeptide repeat protein [Bryobacterales bacterium]